MSRHAQCVPVTRQTRQAALESFRTLFSQFVKSLFLSRSVCLDPLCRCCPRRYGDHGDARLRTGQHYRPGPRCPAGCTECRGSRPGAGCTDKLSGSAKIDRPGLIAMLDYTRAGDTVVVTAIDRLGRSVAEVTRTISDLCDRRIILRALRKGWIPPRQPDALLQGSWPPSPSWNLSWGESAAP